MSTTRRAFLTGSVALLAAPLGVEAQQAGKVPRIGFLSVTSPSDRPHLLDAFRQGLREFGWVEGQNIVIDYRYQFRDTDLYDDARLDPHNANNTAHAHALGQVR